MTAQLISSFLTDCRLMPVLVDVGASGATPLHWKAIARSSVGVEFDPDSRDFDPEKEGDFAKSYRVAAAVCPPGFGNPVDLYLTAAPYCSSILPPDPNVVGQYAMAPLFQVDQKAQVPGISLDDALDELAIDRIDWLKLDSQGVDQRIFANLTRERRLRLLALDIEPGLIASYKGEDTFPLLHNQLLEEGYWVARLQPCGTPRGRPRAGRVNQQMLYASSVDAACWVEGTYLRSVESLDCNQTDNDAFLLLTLFAIVLGHFAFASEVLDYLDGSLRDADPTATSTLRTIIEKEIRRRHRAGRLASLWHAFRRAVRSDSHSSERVR